MKIGSKLMICAAGLYSYLAIKSAIEIDKRFEELEKYEEEIDKKLHMVEKGIDINKVIDVDFKKVL